MISRSGFLATLWKRAMLRNIQFSDAHNRLDLLYKLPDPWGMETAREEYRFRETNDFLLKHVGRVDTLLEVGCGEGHQTQALQIVARNIVGIDVSPTAIQRARVRAPAATFIVGAIDDLAGSGPNRRFEVVAACEMLYYVKDVPAYIRKLERLGRHIVASYVETRKDRLDPIVLSRMGVKYKTIAFEQTKWTIAIWQGSSDA
jgi:2-polyprenyl-3-methyl-5-hydroxy-6-metoxy-1,4-benzoquinol methylase